MADPSPSDEGRTPPRFHDGVEEIARALAQPHDPASDQATVRVADAGAQPTMPVAGASPSRPRVPSKLGPYLVGEEIAHGGFGYVFRARHEKLGTACAVKVLIAGEHASPELIARFQREAAAVARMGKHPNIVAVFDLGEEAGLAYYSMELVEGRSLYDERKARDLSPREAAVIIEKTARALHFAHQHGIVHRDVKPQNIMMTKGGEPQVMDFGLARDAGSEEHLSITGQVMGTPAYMAPEQAAGEMGAIDARTDVYALGGVLYELLSGIPPHPGKSFAQVLPIILKGDLVPLRKLRPDVPRDLETIAMKALALEPARRYQTAEAMADDLARWTRGEPILARPAGPVRKALLFYRRHTAACSAAAVVCAVLATLAGIWYRTPGTLKLSVRPAAARALVDGRPSHAGELTLAAGGHVVEVSAPDCAPQKQEVLIERRGVKEMSIELLHHKGTLTAECSAADSRIQMGKRVFGPLITEEELDTGTWVCKAWAPGHFEKEVTVDVRQGQLTSAYFWLDNGVVWSQSDRAATGVARVIPDVDGDGGPDLACLDMTRFLIRSGRDGREIWSWTEGIGPHTGFYPFDLGGSTGRVVVICGEDSNQVVCVQPTKAGKDRVLWKWSPSHRQTGAVGYPGAVALDDVNGDGVRELAVCDRDGHLWIIEGLDGREIGEYSLPTPSPTLVPLSLEGQPSLLFGGNSYAGSPDRPVAVGRMDPRDGHIAWTISLGTNGVSWLQAPWRFVVYAREDRWGVLDGIDGKIVFERIETPPNLWRVRYDCTDTSPRDQPPAYLFIADHGTVRAFRGRDGAAVWCRQLSAIGLLARPTESSVLVFTTDSVMALNMATGETRWALPGNAQGPGDPLFGEGRAETIFGMPGVGLVCVDGEGRKRWTLRLPIDAFPFCTLPDPDGSGLAAIVAGTNGVGLQLLRPPRILWERPSPRPVLATPLLVDAEGHGTLDVVTLGFWLEKYTLVCFEGRTGAFKWGRQGAGTVNRPPAVAHWLAGGPLCLASGGASTVKPEEQFEVVRVSDGEVVTALPGPPPGPSSSYAIPAFVDLEGDGVPDVAIQRWDSHDVVAVSGRDGHALWRFETGKPNMGGLGVADLDGDGLPDLVAPSTDGFTYALSGRDGSLLWKAETGPSRSPPTLYDLDGDGVPDVLLVTSEGRLWVLDGRTGKTLLSRWKGSEAIGRAAVQRVEGQGTVIVAPLGGAGCLAFRWEDKKVLWQGPEKRGVNSSPVIADLDGDGDYEVVVGTWEGDVFVLDLLTGKRLWSIPGLDPEMEADPAVGDLDGDGVLDIVVAGKNGLHAIDGAPTSDARRRMK